MNQGQIQEQKLEQKLAQSFSQQQLLQAQLVELPITQLLERINTEMNDNPALEADADRADYLESPEPSEGLDSTSHAGGTTAFRTRPWGCCASISGRGREAAIVLAIPRAGKA